MRLKPKVTLHDIAAGKPLVGRNDVVYVTDRDLVLSSGGVWDSSKERNFSTVRNARYNAAIEIAGFREDNIQFEQKDLLSRYEGKNHVVLKAPDENFIMVSSRTSINGQAEYELKVYKDVKGDKSLYQIAGYDHAPASQGNATLSAVVEDAEIGKFKFDTNFTGNTVSQDMYEYSALRDFMPASDGYTRIAEQLNKPIFMPAAAVAPSITSKR